MYNNGTTLMSNMCRRQTETDTDTDEHGELSSEKNMMIATPCSPLPKSSSMFGTRKMEETSGDLEKSLSCPYKLECNSGTFLDYIYLAKVEMCLLTSFCFSDNGFQSPWTFARSHIRTEAPLTPSHGLMPSK